MLPCCAIGVVIVSNSQHSADGIHAHATTNECSLMSAVTVERTHKVGGERYHNNGVYKVGALNWESFAMP